MKVRFPEKSFDLTITFGFASYYCRFIRLGICIIIKVLVRIS